VNNLVKWVELPTMGDDRGSLVALEAGSTIPFEIRRVYYLFATKKNVTRGLHAHLKLKQVLVCVSGCCQILLDDGDVRESVILESPSKGLLVQGLIWRELAQFSSNCVLLVLASEHYDESDYIRSYEDFKEAVLEGK
jgi:dTDP-4-dehydrorhamnose 3,5-epimerase-like enzyme